MIEISFYYKTLYKLSVFHNYYAEQPSNDFRLVPTAESEKLAKRLGLIIKDNDGEYVLMYEPEKLEGLLAEVENKYPIKFTYLLYSSNPYFINFTDLPIENRSGIYYFSNNMVNQSDKTTYMHPSEFAGITESADLKTEIEISANEKEKLIELKDDHGMVVYKSKLSQGEKLIISNKNVSLGKYQLYENGKLTSTFVLFSNVPVKRPIAIVDISLSGIIKKEFMNGVKENEVPFYNYAISFSSRNTFWKYFLIGKYNTNLKNTVIDSGGIKLKFKGPEEVKMQNGTDAIMFVSESPLPLKQINDLRFQLKNVRMGISSGKTIMDRLPLPSPEMIKPESREQNSKIFSEIIVNI
jgi:hypothetical protein